MKGLRSNRQYLPNALWLYDLHGVIRLFYFAGKGKSMMEHSHILTTDMSMTSMEHFRVCRIRIANE